MTSENKSELIKVLVPERKRVCKVSGVEVVDFVTFSLEGEDGVGAEPHAPIHPGSEVDPEEGEARVRDLDRRGTEI